MVEDKHMNIINHHHIMMRSMMMTMTPKRRRDHGTDGGPTSC